MVIKLEETNVVTNLISSLGYPIVTAIFMAWLFIKYNTQNREDRLKQQEAHKAEIDELRKVVEQNTLTVQRLVDQIDRIIPTGDEHNGT